MTSMSVDPTRLAEAAGRFDEQGERVTTLLDRFSALMDPVVGGVNPATAPLTVYAPTVQRQKDGLRTLQEFCFGMADQIRAASTDYDRTDDQMLVEAEQLLAMITAALPGAGAPGPPMVPGVENGDS